ncbi:MAG: 3-oxoacyl-[acyl-carrier protein] reductase [Candidatus Carbobacillus altaicus]|uniref:3-oxoacyl-[acyl-carrier-protein] reductase n=1 Tax=Candidatus Carbonibacillus altaicus TaxID=2163959 RepID=A0A2R6Y1V7_9BACL|nr:MAG: 3-oxoacyl-[acyl-carrier protein] reductase [Candidatus Carbobacillus altaicus]
MGMRDHVAIITGGGSGIGWAAVKAFAERGARVVIADWNADEGRKAEDAVHALGGEARFVAVDVSQPESVAKLVETVLGAYGQIDILINNAGITRDAMLHKMSYEAWQRVIDVNLSGVFYCTQAVVRPMRKRGYGRIINTSSIVGRFGNVGQTNYAAAKAGVIGMTLTWAKELGPKGITVNAVAPGFIRTPMTAAMPPDILQQMAEKVPVGRLGEPEDIARVYLFLADEASGYINGAVISVDGGLSL